MPIYEYECGKCGEIFEVMQKISEPPPSRHTCGSKRVKRLMSRTSFILKGEGWYVTDYGRKGKSEGDAKGRKGGKTGDKSADKPESAPKSGEKSTKKAGSQSAA